MGTAVSKPLNQLTYFLDETLSQIFQPGCLVCGVLCGRNRFCPMCDPFIPVSGALCERCGTSVHPTIELCGVCYQQKRPTLLKIRSQFWLGEGARALIHKVKYSKRFELLSLFKPSLTRDLFIEFPKDLSIIAVPLHSKKFLQRGFNQSHILATWLGKLLKLPVLAGLRKTKYHLPQSQQKLKKRMENVRGSFSWASKTGPPRRVLLVDDIYTSGATLRACSKTLRRTGVKEVYAWTLLRTPEKGATLSLSVRHIKSQ